MQYIPQFKPDQRYEHTHSHSYTKRIPLGTLQSYLQYSANHKTEHKYITVSTGRTGGKTHGGGGGGGGGGGKQEHSGGGRSVCAGT